MRYYPTVLSQSLIHIALNQLEKRNIRVGKKNTTVRMEPEFWHMFREIAELEAMSLPDLYAMVNDRKHPDTSLSSALRVFVAAYLRSALREATSVKNQSAEMIG